MPGVIMTLVQLDILSDITGWFGEVWDQIKAVDVQYLVLGCALQTVQTTLNGLAWRNILAESYGHEKVPVRPIIASYAGGLGLNSFLPADVQANVGSPALGDFYNSVWREYRIRLRFEK